MTKNNDIMGIASFPTLPGAPAVSEDAHVRHLFRTVEGQRNLALSSLAEVVAQFNVLKEQYAAHVGKLSAELSAANGVKATQSQEITSLRLEIAELKKAPDNVTPKPAKVKGKPVVK